MESRAQDMVDKAAELEKALSADDTSALFEVAQRADLALQFRDTDAMIGLDEVDESLVEKVDALVDRALEAAGDAGIAEAHGLLVERRLREEDFEAAADHALAGARAGHADAAEWAAKLARAGIGDAEAVVAALEPLAEKDAAAAVQLGYLRFNGVGCEQDHEASFALQQSAAKRGNADAMFELYVMCNQGLGCEADASLAIEWVHKAAEAGNARAMSNLGGMYTTGNGVDRDIPTAVKWYDAAAQAGHGRAAAVLGIMYVQGDDLDKDDDKARQYFELSEENDFDWYTLADAAGVDVDAFLE